MARAPNPDVKFVKPCFYFGAKRKKKKPTCNAKLKITGMLSPGPGGSLLPRGGWWWCGGVTVLHVLEGKVPAAAGVTWEMRG
jgi:hypothetical protein